MKITLIRQDNGSGKETLSICEAGTLFDKMKTETKGGAYHGFAGNYTVTGRYVCPVRTYR